MQKTCLICYNLFELVKSGPRKYCLNCKKVAKLKRNKGYGDRHSKDWFKQYSQSPQRQLYMIKWKQANPTWIRDHWRKKREPKKQAKEFTKSYLTNLLKGLD